MAKDNLTLPNIMDDFLQFYWEFITKVDGRQQKLMLVSKNGTRVDIPYLFAKMEY